MRAKNFLSEKTRAHLNSLDLSSVVDDLHNVHENMLEELPHYIMRFPYKHYSALLSQVRNLGAVTYTNGALFNTKAINTSLRRSYEEYVEKNAFLLSRELACSLVPIKGSLLRMDKESAVFITSSLRKLIHKAWLYSTWKGEVYGDDLDEFLDETEQEYKKVKTVKVLFSEEKRVFAQRGANLFALKGVYASDIHLYHQDVTKHSSLEIISIGKGSLFTDESVVPVFNFESKFDMYLVAKNSEGHKHLIGFPDINVLFLRKKLGVTSWVLNRICNSYSTFQYLLEGVTKDNITMIECYGRIPFIHPQIERT